MKIHLIHGFKWFFAISPHMCARCHNVFWFEKGIKRADDYGDTFVYCKECAPSEWDEARKKVQNLKGETK